MNVTPLPMIRLNHGEDRTDETTYEPADSTVPSNRRRHRKICLIVCGICWCPICLIIGLVIAVTVWRIITSLQFDITCHFNNSEKNHYVTGETISVKIDAFHHGRSVMNLQDVRVIVIGELVYHTEGGDTQEYSLPTRKIIFLNQILIPQSINTSNEIHVPVGNHSRLFNGHLDHGLPPTINSSHDETPCIYYYIEVEIVPSEWYYLNFNRTYPIVVRRQPSTLSNRTKVTEHNNNQTDIQIYATIQKNVVVVGDTLAFDVELRNPNQLEISSIWVEFTGIWERGNQFTERVIFAHEELERLDSFRDRSFYGSYNLHVPQTIPGTFSFRHPFHVEKSFKMGYELVVEVSVAGTISREHHSVKLSLIIINENYMTNDKSFQLA